MYLGKMVVILTLEMTSQEDTKVTSVLHFQDHLVADLCIKIGSSFISPVILCLLYWP